MEILYLKSVESTQQKLIKDLKNKKLSSPICLYTDNQTAGIGSRGNSWIGEKGNLFFSFSINMNELSNIPMQSISIYFGYLFKETLNKLGSRVILKWPNDIYLNKKIGGIITNIIGKNVVCGIGLNTFSDVDEFDKLDIEVDNISILNYFFEKVEKKISWNEVFDKFKVEFYKTNFITSEGINLKNSVLNNDGSITINNERRYSLR